MIQAIVFDLGGVLFTDGTKQFIEYLCTSHGVDKTLANELLNGSLGSRYREGKITRDEFWCEFKHTLQLDVPSKELESQWCSGYHLNPSTERLIITLAKQYDVYYLSDNVQERIDVLESRYHFLNLFKDGVFSHLVGMRKPNLGIYKLALSKTGVTPEKVLFIDDKAEALAPAHDLGMATILFKDASYAAAEMRKMGVL